MGEQREVARSVVVNAPAEDVFEVLADPRRHAEIDGSGTIRGALLAPDRLSLGAKFGMRMSLGLPYAVRNTVVIFEEGRRIGWRHVGHHVWRWELDPIDAVSTTVTETFDWSRALAPLALELANVPARNGVSIERSLDKLQALFP